MEAARHRRIRHFADGKIVLVRIEQLPVQPLQDRRNAMRSSPAHLRRNGPHITRARQRPVRRIQLCNSSSALDHFGSLRRGSHCGSFRVHAAMPRATCIPSMASMSTTPRPAGSRPMVCSRRHLQRIAKPIGGRCSQSLKGRTAASPMSSIDAPIDTGPARRPSHGSAPSVVQAELSRARCNPTLRDALGFAWSRAIPIGIRQPPDIAHWCRVP